MKLLALLIMLPLSAFALDPAGPVVRLEGANIVERRVGLPDRHATDGALIVNYRSAGEWQWFMDGWRQASVTTITNSTTIEIPVAIQNVAASYKAALEGIYGSGAVTNRELTSERVAIELSLRPDVTAETGIRLSTWFEILNTYWGRGEVWSFPYGQSTYTVETTEEVWSVIP